MPQQSSPIRLLPVVICVILVVCVFKLTSHFVFDEDATQAIGTALAQDGDGDEVVDEANLEEEELDPEATGEFGPDEEETEGETEAGLFITPAEQDVLESLQQRRQELEQREQELELRERLLQAAEQRVEERIAELSAIEARIEASFGQHAENRREQMQNLVSLYENMKPKDAAAIFDRLEMAVLIDVVEQMQTRKMAPILARMDPGIAERLTVELAARAEERAGTLGEQELESAQN